MTRKRLLIGVIVIGLGLVAAPAVFQMFTRAPKGGRMIEDFRPFMERSSLGSFRKHIALIGSVDGELGRIEDPSFLSGFDSVKDFRADWPVIRREMSGMLNTIDANLDNFAAVDALPPFPLFPWFFVVPGLLVASIGWLALRGGALPLRLLMLLGLGLIAAPFVFQMFGRAPLGGRMIEEFRPLMSTSRVTEIQGYFLTIGSAEGELRNEVLPLLKPDQFPATSAFVREWPEIAADMAPMVGAMSDNIDNFLAVDALPPFGAFPWFFVTPGALIFLLASRASVPSRRVGVAAQTGAGLLMVIALGACGSSPPAGGPNGELAGLFKLTAGECTSGQVKGSYFRMVNPGGDTRTGPFVGNNDSACTADKNVTPLIPGSDGGLLAGEYQPHPSPAFDESGNASASRIIQPATWFGVRFSLATNPKDPQTGLDVPAPNIRVNEGRLTGDIRSFAAAWNGQHFNQGTPKPDGSRSGNTSELTGRYDDSAKTFIIEWMTQIVGGPFSNFTGTWHLEGTFEG